jgi:hypothetical protein
MQTYHVTLPQCTDIRWILRGKVLTRISELREGLLPEEICEEKFNEKIKININLKST